MVSFGGMMAGANGQVHGVVLGHGVDIVDINDFSRLLKEPADRFLDRHFSVAERTAAGSGGVLAEKLAGRFATKEAVMKALGVGWGDGVSFTDVEVVIDPAGAPTVVLRRQLADIAKDRAIVRWLVSTSHAGAFAVASVIALGDAVQA